MTKSAPRTRGDGPYVVPAGGDVKALLPARAGMAPMVFSSRF
ncbi:hypothetical protein [Streptomyces bobili]